MPTEESTPAVQYRDIPNCPGYRVGDDGSMWSCWRLTSVRGGGFSPVFGATWRLLKPHLRKRDGYCEVRIRSNGKRRQCKVHRLVLEAFVGPCPPGMVACHDPDPTPSNNALSNLRWDTTTANVSDSRRHGRHVPPPRPRGENHPAAKLTRQDVFEARSSRASGESVLALSKRFGVCRTAMSAAINGRTWKWLTSSGK